MVETLDSHGWLEVLPSDEDIEGLAAWKLKE
jgi:hypothetical protein